MKVLIRVKKLEATRKYLKTKRKNVRYLLRHDEFITNLMKGKVEGKRGRGRPRIAYDHIKSKKGATSYKNLCREQNSV